MIILKIKLINCMKYVLSGYLDMMTFQKAGLDLEF